MVATVKCTTQQRAQLAAREYELAAERDRGRRDRDAASKEREDLLAEMSRIKVDKSQLARDRAELDDLQQAASRDAAALAESLESLRVRFSSWLLASTLLHLAPVTPPPLPPFVVRSDVQAERAALSAKEDAVAAASDKIAREQRALERAKQQLERDQGAVTKAQADLQAELQQAASARAQLATEWRDLERDQTEHRAAVAGLEGRKGEYEREMVRPARALRVLCASGFRAASSGRRVADFGLRSRQRGRWLTAPYRPESLLTRSVFSLRGCGAQVAVLADKANVRELEATASKRISEANARHEAANHVMAEAEGRMQALREREKAVTERERAARVRD